MWSSFMEHLVDVLMILNYLFLNVPMMFEDDGMFFELENILKTECLENIQK